MPFLNAMDPDDKVPEKQVQQDEKIDRGLLGVILLAIPIITFPFFTGRAELLIGVSMSTAVSVLAIAKCWDLRKRLWFWIVIALIQALNASLAVFAHWPRVTMTRLTLLPIGVAYYLLTLGVVRSFDRFIFKSRESS